MAQIRDNVVWIACEGITSTRESVSVFGNSEAAAKIRARFTMMISFRQVFTNPSLL